MNKLIVGVVIGVILTAAAFVVMTRTMDRPRPTSAPPEEKVQAVAPSPKFEERQNPPAPVTPAKAADEPKPPKQDLATASLSEQLKAYRQQREQLTLEQQKEKLEKLKHIIAADSPEIDVLEMRRDAEISAARLLNKHSGQLYKFAGLILETTPHDTTIVIKNSEIVCSFADTSWKSEGLKVGGYLYACGFFESFKDEGDFKQITMANCYTIENFYKLRATPFTEEERQQSLKDFQEDALYKLQRDLGARKLRQ